MNVRKESYLSLSTSLHFNLNVRGDYLMRLRTNHMIGFFIGGLLLGAWFLFFGAPPARAMGETCPNGSPAPCVEDIQITVCNKCHSIAIPGGNRNGTDRIVTASDTINRGAAHVLDPLSDRGAWLTIVTGMLSKFGLATDPTPIAGFFNTNYCTTCTGPILGSPMQSNVAGTTATVTWSTSANGWEDEPTDTVLFYGANEANVLGCTSTAGCPGVSVFTDSAPVGHHVANLTGLSCGVKYFMVNQATSARGTTRSTYSVNFRTKTSGPGCAGGGAPVPPRVFVSDNESTSGPDNDHIVVIDPNPFQIDGATPNPNYNHQIGSVTISGKEPADLVAHPNGTEAYAVVGANLSVLSIDSSTLNASEFASLLLVGGLFNELAISPDGKRLYLAYRPTTPLTLLVKVYDLTDSTQPVLLTTISDPLFNGCSAPLGLGVSTDGSKLYLPCTVGNGTPPDRFYLVDTATSAVTQTATFSVTTDFAFANAVTVKPDGSAVYMGHGGSGGTGSTVEVFDGASGASVASIPMPGSSSPLGGVFGSDGNTLYIADTRAGTRVIDSASNTLIRTMPAATSHGYDIAITPDGARLYTPLGVSVFANDATVTTGNWIATITGDYSTARNVAITPGKAGTITLLPDVVMTAVTPIGTAAAPGDVLSITDTVKNQGKDSTLSGFEIAYALSPTPSFDDPAAAVLQTIRFVGALGVDATDTATTNLAVPYFIAPGNYYVCAKADPTQALAESNSDNNTLCSATTIQVTLPDLVVSAVSPNASSAAPGGALSVTDSVQNQGGAHTTVTTFVGYSLSVNTIYGDSDDLPITTTRAVGLLGPGEGSTATTNLAMPATVPPNDYHVCATADSTAVVAELSETNNALCSTATISVSIADLIMSAVSTTATGAAPGGSFTLSNTAKNQGGGTAGAFTVAFHLSTDQTYGGADDIPFTTTRSVSGLNPGSTSTASTSLTVPTTTPLGPYYVCALADSGSAVDEGGGVGESNNSLCTSAPIQVSQPDLIMTAVTPNAPTVSGTGTLSVTDTVKNIGAAAASSFKVGYKLSPSASYDDPGAVASSTTRTISSLAPGASNTATTTVTFSSATPPGAYYLCAKADSADAVAELPPSGETNNTLCSTTTVTMPQADLIMTAVTPNASTVSATGTLSVTNTAKNQGALNAGSFTVGFKLSPTASYDNPSAVAIATTRAITSLAAGASSSATTTLAIPTTTPPGPYYVCAKADTANTVNEGSNEGNNTLCSPGTVTMPAADLIMTAVSTATTAVAPGKTLTVSSTAMNQGGIKTGSFTIGFVLSTNTTVGDGDDIALAATRSVSSLAAGASSTANTVPTIPTTTPFGAYYICALADSGNTVNEGPNEGNNSRCTSTTVQVSDPDLILTAVTTTATTVNKGASFSVSSTVQNQGPLAAGAFRIAFHLSPNTIYGDGDDVVINAVRSVTSLAAGASSTGSTSITLPGTTPSGTYYVCTLADSLNQVTELDETNNTRCSPTQITVP
jgi:subtilase family serine protease